MDAGASCGRSSIGGQTELNSVADSVPWCTFQPILMTIL